MTWGTRFSGEGRESIIANLYRQPIDLLTRRDFLEKFSALAVGVSFVSSSHKVFAAAASEPHISFPSAPRDRVAVASYPFRAYIESPANRDRDRNLPGMALAAFAWGEVKNFNVT